MGPTGADGNDSTAIGTDVSLRLAPLITILLWLKPKKFRVTFSPRYHLDYLTSPYPARSPRNWHEMSERKRANVFAEDDDSFKPVPLQKKPKG